ncbi:ParA family protein [Cellulomonas endophytica]|uniref:ParA family protein n=1 Tax=Cellulomonas endophytica TaxID=2494735 RepID=UPI001012027B|nr:ParA family protein [Cellulomonas endophytica]
MDVVALWSVKGGVGKTTAAVNLAHAAAAAGETLLWDLDPQGAATHLLEVKPKLRGGAEALVQGRSTAAAALRQTAWERLDVLPADRSLRDLELVLDAAKRSERRVTATLDPLRDRYGVAVLDCPPGASLLARNVLRAADLVLVPLPPAPLALRSLDQVLELVAEEGRDVPVRAFLSMVDRRKATHRAAVADLPRTRPEVLDVVVPAAVAVERMGELRAPLAAFAPRTPAALAYADLWAAVTAVLHPAPAAPAGGGKGKDRAGAGRATKDAKDAKDAKDTGKDGKDAARGRRGRR